MMFRLVVFSGLLIVSSFAFGARELEAPLREVSYKMQNGLTLRVGTTAKGELDFVVLKSRDGTTRANPSDFGKIEDVVLNGLKVYADGSLNDAGTFDYIVYVKIPFGWGSGDCYRTGLTGFPHSCNVLTVFFKNGKLVEAMTQVEKLEEPDK